MSTLTGGAIAFIVGLALAGATAFGVVQQQQSAGADTAESSSASYGTNG